MTGATEANVSTKSTPAFVGMGSLMILLGLTLVVLAFFYNVGVSTGVGGMYGLPDQVANTDKVATRSMILACGLTSFISGWIALIGGLILERLKSI